MKFLLFISVLISLSIVVYSAARLSKDFGNDRKAQLTTLYGTMADILENIKIDIPKHAKTVKEENEAVEYITNLINKLRGPVGDVNIGIDRVIGNIQNPFGEKGNKPLPIDNIEELKHAIGLTDTELKQANINAIATAVTQLKSFLSKQTPRQPQPPKLAVPAQNQPSESTIRPTTRPTIRPTIKSAIRSTIKSAIRSNTSQVYSEFIFVHTIKWCVWRCIVISWSRSRYTWLWIPI
jgi:hypothetical protein